MKVNQLKGLNRQARKELLKNNISVRMYPILATLFEGHLNGMWREGITLERKNGKWYHFSTGEEIQSINGKIHNFIIA